MNNNRGFTLIELLIVIAIIGILAAIAIPQIQKAMRDRENAEVVANKKPQPILTAEEAIINYATESRPDLNEWTKPKCRKRDTNNVLSGFEICTISGRNKLGKYEIIAAECAVGKTHIGNEGCNPMMNTRQ